MSVVVAGALLVACGGGDDDSAPEPAGADEPAAAEPPDEASDGGDESRDASAAGPTGRLEIDGETFNLGLGEMTTAMCSVSESSITIQDMRAPDGSWVAVFYDAGGDVWEVTFRGSDGNRRWVTGNSDIAEGLPVDYLIADNVVSVSGSWVSAEDPATTTEGRLVVTC
jgi:hypothetical protein